MRSIYPLIMIFAVGCSGTAGTGGAGGAGGQGSSTSASSAEASSSSQMQICIPGKVYACPCPGGAGGGVQTCDPSGQSLGPCTGCDASTSSSSSVSSSSSGAGGADGGAMGEPCSDGYPAGPYGIQQGDTIDNYSLTGFVDYVASNQQQTIDLCHFYNPTGMAKYPPGSQYGGGSAKPKALLLTMMAVWAAPCNQESKTDLPPRHSMYKPLGGEILSVLIDGPSPGVPATIQNLVSWDVKYAVDYPSAYSAAPGLSSFPAYPAGLIIDLRTMKIAKVILGIPSAQDWSDYAALLQ